MLPIVELIFFLSTSMGCHIVKYKTHASLLFVTSFTAITVDEIVLSILGNITGIGKILS